MSEFIDNLIDGLVLSCVGLSKRCERLANEDKTISEEENNLIAKGMAILSLLNLDYKITVLPENEYQLVDMFTQPLSETLDKLPTNLLGDFLNEYSIEFYEPFFEEIGDRKYRQNVCCYNFIDSFLGLQKCNRYAIIQEYYGVKLYNELKSGDIPYVEKRMYIITHPVIEPEKSFTMNEWQKKLMELAYKPAFDKNGNMLLDNLPDEYKNLLNKEQLNANAKILQGFAVSNIFLPGLFEKELFKFLEKRVENLVKYPQTDRYDAWFTYQNKKIAIDAKTIKNFHSIITEAKRKIQFLPTDNVDKLIYIIKTRKTNEIININDKLAQLNLSDKIVCMNHNQFYDSFRQGELNER